MLLMHAVTESYGSNLTLFVLQVGKQAQLHDVTVALLKISS